MPQARRRRRALLGRRRRRDALGHDPLQALRRAIYNVNLLANSPVYKKLDVVPVYDFPELLATAANVVETQADLRQSFYDRNHVPLIPGSARFLNPETIEVSFEEAPSGGSPRRRSSSRPGRARTARRTSISPTRGSSTATPCCG